MELCITYDMRGPDFGAQRNYLYDTALDQVSWADELGFDVVGLGEHHGSEDGYNPSPLILAASMAGRTRHIALRTSVLLATLYDLPKLAEDAAITQIIAKLADNDHVGLVTFASDIRVDIPLKLKGKNEAAFNQQVNSLNTRGATAFYAGVLEGTKRLSNASGAKWLVALTT